MDGPARTDLHTQYQNYPYEVLREMRRLGMKRPADCPVGVWEDLTQINHRHETIIELMLAGWPKYKIADHLGYARSTLSALTARPTFIGEYEDARRARRAALDKAAVTVLYPNATEVLKSVMCDEDEKGSVRLDAAKYVIDQTVGKPEQKVHQTGSILHEVLSRVEELKSRPVSEATDLLDQPKSAIDTFIDDNIPEGFSVGQRGGTDESEGEYKTDESESGVREGNLENSDYYS